MPIEQEPIKIDIPVEEDEVVFVAERRRRDVVERVEDGTRRAVERGREVWQSERRRQVKRSVATGVRHGVRASRVGLARGLNWLSARLAGAAERFTPVE